VLSEGRRTIARDRLVLPLFKELAWSPAAASVRLEGGEAVFTSPVFTWGVCLDLGGERSLADNFFDLFPGQEYRIPWSAAEPPRILRTGNLA
jgi:hypothetical protein